MFYRSAVVASVIGSRSISSNVCADKTNPICLKTDTGVDCVSDPVNSVCVETCPGSAGASEADCRAFGPNCIHNSTDNKCEFAPTCGDVAVPDLASTGDSCAPNMILSEDCVVEDPNGNGTLVCAAVEVKSTTQEETTSPGETTTAIQVTSGNETTSPGETTTAIQVTSGNETTSPGETLTAIQVTSGNETTSPGETLTAGQVTSGNETTSSEETLTAIQVTSGDESTDVELSTVSGINSFVGVVSLFAATMFAF